MITKEDWKIIAEFAGEHLHSEVEHLWIKTDEGLVKHTSNLKTAVDVALFLPFPENALVVHNHPASYPTNFSETDLFHSIDGEGKTFAIVDKYFVNVLVIDRKRVHPTDESFFLNNLAECYAMDLDEGHKEYRKIMSLMREHTAFHFEKVETLSLLQSHGIDVEKTFLQKMIHRLRTNILTKLM